MSRSWAARHLPAIRGEYVDTMTKVARLSPKFSRVLPGRLKGLLGSHVEDAARIGQAELFWVTRDMAALALDASTDMPDFDPGVLPSPHGLVAFAEPLPAVAVEAMDLRFALVQGKAPIWAISWIKRPGEYRIGAWTRLQDFPGGAPTMPGELQIVAEFSVSSTDVTPIDTMPVQRLASGKPAEFMRPLIALVGACCVLMMTPTLVERRTLDGRRGTAARPDTKPSDLVSLIDLRPLRQRDDWLEREPGGGVRRDYKHRWVVRGHWRRQPYGPNNSLRRQQYIEPYIAGPPDAPFIATEKVMVWRR